MSRTRAGHGMTCFVRNGRTIWLILNDDGNWITTGEARGWPRCTRCRRPVENSPFGSGLCSTCYFYKNGMSTDEFWRLHDEGYPLAPYNIGSRFTEAIFDTRILGDPAVDWRRLLRNRRRNIRTNIPATSVSARLETGENRSKK